MKGHQIIIIDLQTTELIVLKKEGKFFYFINTNK